MLIFLSLLWSGDKTWQRNTVMPPALPETCVSVHVGRCGWCVVKSMCNVFWSHREALASVPFHFFAVWWYATDVSPVRYVAAHAEVQSDRNVCSHVEQSLSVFLYVLALCWCLQYMLRDLAQRHILLKICTSMIVCVCVSHKTEVGTHAEPCCTEYIMCVCVHTCISGVCVCTTGGWWLVVMAGAK